MKQLIRLLKFKSVRPTTPSALLLSFFVIVFLFADLCFAEPIKKSVVKAVSEYNHTCTITKESELYCWGDNGHGQLGDGTTDDKMSPTKITTIPTIKDVSVGRMFSCAVANNNKLYCWGNNSYGELGDGTNTERHTPDEVTVISEVKVISTGWYHACAITSDNKLYCWGYNGHGQLGPGGTDNKNAPIEVVTLPDVKDVSLGAYHTCAVTNDSKLYCWGYNNRGQLGDGTTTESHTPKEVTALSGVKAVRLGHYHSCAIKSDNKLYCWGSPFGGGSTPVKTPIEISDFSGVKDIRVGASHICVVTSDSEFYCWGSNDYGQIGDGTTTDESTPTEILTPPEVETVSLGDSHTCVITDGNKLYCWGRNNHGQIGDGTTIDRLTPTEIFSGDDCSSDTDGDGTNDCLDECPTDGNKIEEGICGCGAEDIDTDGDGTYDCNDGCIDDPDKQAEGICGCGTADTDTDGDGTPDCHDNCPNNAPKTEPGVCGCEIADTDSDGDGTPDCNDACPDDPAKQTSVGECGCGYVDVPGCGVVACAGDPHLGDIGNNCDTGKLGECKVGKWICEGDVVNCKQQNEAADSENCGDGKDNDCNGLIDEADPACNVTLQCATDPNVSKLNKVCYNGKGGECKTTGLYECKDNKVTCNADPNIECQSSEVEFDPYDYQNSNPPEVEQYKKPLPPYVTIKGGTVTLYFQWFAEFMKFVENLKAWFVSKACKGAGCNKPKKQTEPSAEGELSICKEFKSVKTLQAAERKCQQSIKTGARLNKVAKCKKVKQCKKGGFSAKARGGFALKQVKKQIITATKMKNLSKKGKVPNIIQVKRKKGTYYSFRYRIVMSTKKGQIKKKLTSFSDAVEF